MLLSKFREGCLSMSRRRKAQKVTGRHFAERVFRQCPVAQFSLSKLMQPK